MRNSIISTVKILTAIIAVAVAPQVFGVANYVYHERTANDPGCGGQYVSVFNPSSAQAYPLRFKVEYQFFTDTTKVYYTTDGSAPSGSKGVASGTTLIADGSFVCTFGAPLVDVWTASIPAQPAGTVVKYIVGAWHSGGGDEIFANSGTCEGCGNFNNSSLATVFQYTVGSIAELYWDSNGATAGAGATPTGTWGTDDFWSTVFDGTAATGPWVADLDAVFSAGTDASGPFTVTVSATQSANRLRFEEGTVSVSGGTVTLTGAGDVNVASGLSATLGSILAGTVGLTKSGSGTLALTGANTYTGSTKGTAGILDFTTDGNFGATPGAFAQDSIQLTDSTLRFSGAAVITLHANRGFTLGGAGATVDCVGGGGILFIPNIIDGAGTTLTKVGTGELGLYGASNKFGKLVLDLGTLRTGQSTFNGYDESYGGIPSVFTADAITIRNGATNRTVGGAPISISANRGITLGAGGGVFRSDVQPLTIHSAITGPGGLRKEGNRNFTLNGNNTYLGSTVLNGIQAASATRAIMTFNGYNETTGPLIMNEGRLILSNYNNFASVTVNAGRIDVNTNGAIGTGLITIMSTTTNIPLLVNSASHGPTLNITLNNDLVVNAGVTNTADISANSGRELVLSGKVSGTANWIKNNSGSTGALVLGNENNDFSGSAQAFAGTLIAAANNALGATTAGTLINSGASLAFRGGINYSAPEPVTISGVGRLSGGAISNDSGNNTFSGPVTMAGDSSVGVNVDQLTLAGVIDETGGARVLTKVGASRLVLTAANTYSGGTVISNGILHVANTTGSATGPGPITITPTGALTGPGSVAGTLTVDGTISPGASPGTQNTGSEIWNGGGNYLWEINDVDAGTGTDPGWDLINITGGLTINATSGNKFNLKITSLTLANAAGNVHDFADANDYLWTILTTSGGISGFDAAAFNLDVSGFSNPLGGGAFLIQTANGGNDLVLRFVHPPVIAAGPVGGTAECSSNFVFTVTASGSAPLAYQWKHEGTNLPGEIAPSLTVVANPSTAGNYTVDVSNAYGAATGGPAALTSVDSMPPTIDCGQNETLQCGLAWDFTVPIVADACDGNNVTLTIVSSVTNVVCGNAIIATRIWQVTDQSANSTTCTQVVTVVDNVAPMITCAPNATVECGTPWDFTSPTASDSCNPDNVTVTVLSTVTNSVVGGYAVTRTWEGSDVCTNTATCAQTITVLDTVAPTLVCPSDISVCTSSNSAIVSFTPVSTDACDATPNVICTPASGSEFPLGSNPVSCTASDDAGNSTNCMFNVTVNAQPTVSVNSATICAGGSAILTATHNANSPSFLWSPGGATTASITVSPSSTTIYTVTVTDGTTTCSASASGTVTVNPLPIVSVNSETVCAGGSAILTATHNAANPSFSWSPGGATTASITVSPASTTTYTVTVTDGDTTCSASASGTVTVRGFDSFANTGAITINDLAAGSPYPSAITVSGLTATVCRVTVTLHGLSHDFPDDLDIGLVGPNGEPVLLMSDLGNGFGVSGITLTFDDLAASSLPDATQIVGGTFKPSNIGAKSDGNPDNFPAPAPTVRFGTNLSAFNGMNPNGTWNLFVFDDELVDAGQIAGGWSLSISTLNPIADVGISQLDVPDPVAVGSNVTYTVIATNLGPALATGVLVSDTPPAGTTLVSFGASQGSCMLISGTIWCALGSIAPGASATVTVVVSPNSAGTIVNTASIQNDDVDFNSANNSSTASTTVLNPPVITTPPQDQVVCTDQTATFSVVATGEPPLSYQWYFGIDPISGETGTTLTIPNAQAANAGGYAVVINNSVGATSASATLTVNPLPVVSVMSTTICVGASAELTAVNNASNPSYLWSPGGQTTPSITVSPIVTTVYSVLVTDGATSCTNSASATVTVNDLTTATPLTNVTNACPGTSVSFSTTAGGTGPHTYVWRKNGNVVAGENGPALAFASVAPGDAGTYCVEVTGYCNTVTNCATLTVAAPPTITSQPQNQITPMGNSATFSVTASSAVPLSYQWRLNGSDIAGANASSYIIASATLAQNGESYSVVVSNCAGIVVSSAAILTVTPIAGISFDFDTPGQFTNTAYNVKLNDWLHTILPTLVLETRAGGAGNSGALDVTGTADSSTILHPVSYDFSLDGKTLVASTMVRIVAPTQNNRNTQIAFITTTNAYAGTAPGLTGAGINDVNPIGFMSVILQSTAQPALTYELRLQHRRTDGGIAEVTPAPTPTATLVAGNWYKLVATFRNIKATTANTFTVAASLQDMGASGLAPGAVAMSYPAQNVLNTSIPNQRNMFLAIRSARSDTGADFWDNVYAYATPGAPFFVAQPASQTLAQGRQANLQALVDGEGPYTYQWNKNGSPIPGARNWRYITAPLRLSENGDQYTVTVTSPLGTITSDPATLTVQASALAVVSVGSVDGCSIGVQFNQSVDAASAANPANHLIDGSPAASARVYTSTADPNPTRVILTPTATLSGPYTVSVQNVSDLSGNVIGANSTVGRVEGLTGVDINPIVAAPVGQNYSFGPAQFEIVGGGTDIFTAPDAFRYVYSQRTGDFDVKARVPYQDIVRGPTKTGLEVRTSLDQFAPQVLSAVNPPWPARGLYEGTFRQVYNVGGSSWGAAGTVARYPDAWVRLRRVGNTFLRYSSQNGTTWQLDGQVSPSPAFPDTVYLGLAVCSVANANPQTASIDNVGEFAGYPDATIAITTQPIGAATVTAGGSTNLSVAATVTGAPATELTFVWQRHAGGGVWTNAVAAGQTNTTFNTGPLFIADNGAEYRVVVRVPGAADVTSTTTTVTVTDAAVPTITAAAIPVGSTFQVLINFSEPVSSATALNTANYAVTNTGNNASMGVASVAFLGDDRRAVLLTTVNALVTGAYVARISGVQDLAGNTIAATLRNLSQLATAPAIGPVVIEFFGSLTNGGNLGDLTNNVSSGPPGVKFANDTPDFTTYSNVFGVNPLNANFPNTVDNYGVQMYSYFVAPSSGAFKFYVRADDFAEFRMSTTGTNPASAAVQVTLAANSQVYTLANSVTNTLVAGQRYYLELRFKETGGGDGGTVAVRTDNTVPGQGEVIPASQLAFPDAIAKPTPVVIELYTGQVTLNSQLPNDLGVAFGSGGYPDLLASLNTPAVIARTPNVIGYGRYFGFNSNLVQINATFDNYLGRMYGDFVAPSNGLYKFFVRSDDSSELWMNTNAVNSTDPAGITLLGVVNDFYSVNQTLVAQNVSLAGGQRYYMEGRWRDGGGGDGMTVTFRAQTDLSIPPNTEIMPGTRLEFPINYDRVGPADGTITPVNPIVSQGGTVTFQAANIRGVPGYGIFWLKNGVPVAANAVSFVTQPLTASDNGAVFTLVVSNAFSRAERSTTVTVVPDGAPPTLLGAMGSQYQDLVVLTFSEPLDVAAACTTLNYQINHGVQVYSATIDQDTRRRVTLRTSTQTPGTTYTVTLNNVRDTAGNSIAANTMAAFTAWIAAGRGFYVEIYTNIAGTAVQNLTMDNKLINNLADVAYYTNRLGAGWFGNDTGLNNYGVRVTGLLSAPTNGLYRLYVRGDDGTLIMMNTNGPAASGRVLVARNDGANSGTWENGAGGSFSPILTLDANTLYFTEVFMKEGGGGDHLEVLLRQIDPISLTAIGGVPAPGVNDIVPGDFFVTVGNPDTAQLTVVQAPPADLTVSENDTVTLRARGYASSFVRSMASGYQWQVEDGLGGFKNIAGAIGPTHQFVAPAIDTAYRVIISGPGTNAVYTTTLHSSPDGVGPFIVSAGSLTGTNLDLVYSEPVRNDSGTDPFNYEVNGGAVTIVSIVQREDPRKVTITVDAPLTGLFTVHAFVSDQAPDPGNSGDSTVTGRVSSAYAALDIGAPVAAGSTFAGAQGEFDVSAGGNDIWGNSDVGHITMTPVTGDFDVHVRVAGLTRPDPIAKAGLMMRDTLSADSRVLHTLMNPAQYQAPHPLNPGLLTGRDLGEAAVRFAANNGTVGWQARPESVGMPSPLGNSGFAPCGVPNAWVRLKREGNLFTAFHGYDGVNWRMYARASFSYGRTVQLGVGTTAHTAAQAAGVVTVANYRDIYIPPPPVILVQPSPASQTAPLHSTVNYSVVASNPPPNMTALRYQWYLNGVAIANATSDSLTVSDAHPDDAGVYTVEVNNDGGTTTSIPVTLNVDSGLIAGNDAINTTQNTPISVSTASLLANDSAAAGETPAIVAVSGVFPASFASDFNSGIPAGAQIFGAAGGGVYDTVGGVDNSGVVKLTLNVNNHAGALVLNELAPNRRVTAWNASFMLRIGDGSGEPADGFSFNLAPDIQLTANTGLGENGVGTGFSFCVDNFRFHPYPQGGIANTAGMKIRYRGLDVAGVRIGVWNSPRFIPVSISVTPAGLMTVLVDGTNVFGNLTLPNYAPLRGRVGMYARNGGQNMSQWVDNLSINTMLTVETTREPAINTDTERVLGTANINNGRLQLTEALGSQQGTYLTTVLNTQAMTSLSASFNVRIGGGTARAADGIALSIAPNLDPNATFGEEGAGNYLVVALDTWDNGTTDTAPAFDIKWGGTADANIIATQSFQPSARYQREGGRATTTPPLLDGSAQPVLLDTDVGSTATFVPITLTVEADGTLDLTYKGVPVFSNLAIPGFYGATNLRVGLGGRTGGATDNHWVDDLSVTINTAEGPVVFNNNFNTTPPTPYGTVVLSGGQVVYTPPANVCGPDTFYYLLSSESGGAAIGRVDVTITEGTPTPPTITACATNRTLAAGANCQLALPDLTGEVRALDNCCCVAVTQSPLPGTTLGLGTHTVTFTATDTAGLTAQCQAMITVTDQTPPVITLIGGAVTIECHGNTPIPGATATDNCDGDLTSSIVVSGFVDQNVPAVYLLSYDVSDLAGNPAVQVQRQVTVVDTLPPSITCPANIVTNCMGPGGAAVTYAVIVSDLCDSNVMAVCNPASGSTFPLGVTTVNCTATDASGNTNTCSFTITVQGSGAAPVLTIELVSTNSVRITWPRTCEPYELQQSPSIGPDAIWTPVGQSPTLNGDTYEVTVPTDEDIQFFRLRAVSPTASINRERSHDRLAVAHTRGRWKESA